MIRKDLDKINKDDSERIPQDLPRLLGHWSVFHAAPITQDGLPEISHIINYSNQDHRGILPPDYILTE
ncbi:coatomer subunit beta -2-like, putative [Babesia ovis]|uniref:Coatomer subunit beta -2-like, putative n=1 Tax=Babesia ovis TaxID=5869 RepID=A0A9W5TAJ5_BABOV|nr:coatomer subunit beta -2-like, putative [Babesia ovis]